MGRRVVPQWLVAQRAFKKLERVYARAAGAIAAAQYEYRLAAVRLTKSQRALAAANLLALHEEYFPRNSNPPGEDSVYFVQRVDGGPIKIGFSRNVARRLAALQTSSTVALRVIASVRGSRRDEYRLHRRLAAHRLSGEWFVDCDAVRAAIAELTGS